MQPSGTRRAPTGPLRIGLTGGIASGKSSVSRLFSALGVPVIDTDEIARALVAPGTPLLEQILARFGGELRRSDGSLDRAALRRLVFESPERRRELDALTHPAILARAEQLAGAASGPYQIHVIPLLTETHSASRYDRVLVVDCPEALQLERLQARDGCDAAQAQAMLAAQASRAQRLALADDVIVNDSAPAALVPKVAALDQQYRALVRAAGRDR